MTSRYCSQCGKAMCICSLITPVENRLELIILQHPTEVGRAKGTAAILQLGLSHCKTFVGEDFSQHDELNQLLAEPDVTHWVLFPAEQANSLEQAATISGKLRVILLDGTWKKAYKMRQISINLRNLPCIALPEDLQGNYKIRKSPSDNALSTVEAGYHLLEQLDTACKPQPLLDAFEAMMEQQLAQIPPEVRKKHFGD
ncbi:DTW domain-containing protein [Vibrio sp. SCSIO 43136]|uniref:tRNA-uridine aminocarboxypropyltransferase n=1 Tax=Vibrio sp. SCSIO 43136 TaxID=2819101 RepID=UPI0021845BCE|nr:DTW domain-containing protein [Vibrio sp. SCSIO 43136]USD64466.1 DTW domain-containing protein [Vibrio sp. SCSIO 43136]